jgi:hypothetical protein
MSTFLPAEVQGCIVDCLECYSLCTRDAMNRCVEAGGQHAAPEHLRLMHDCAALCRIAADFMLASSVYSPKICALCAEICQACARSCDGLEGMEACASACRGCAASCRRIAAGAPAAAAA